IPAFLEFSYHPCKLGESSLAASMYLPEGLLDPWMPSQFFSLLRRGSRRFSNSYLGLVMTDNWLLTTGYYSCSASPAALPRNILKIKGLAAQTPPLRGGAEAAQFADNPLAQKHPDRPTVPTPPKKPFKITS
ncbi:MAG: hypothetical protein NTW80_06845, partial [Deltaproteobacteria bacterium]|nr:hypothetical protein [Deltaproteobacteria bacterium]